jgi:hypothetical protein
MVIDDAPGVSTPPQNATYVVGRKANLSDEDFQRYFRQEMLPYYYINKISLTFSWRVMLSILHNGNWLTSTDPRFRRHLRGVYIVGFYKYRIPKGHVNRGEIARMRKDHEDVERHFELTNYRLSRQPESFADWLRNDLDSDLVFHLAEGVKYGGTRFVREYRKTVVFK